MKKKTIRKRPAAVGRAPLGAKLRQLAAFNEIGKTLTSSLDQKEILHIVMEKIGALLAPERWNLLLVDEDTQELKFEIAVGEGSEKFKDARIRPGEGVAGWVAREKAPLLVPDVSRDPRFARPHDGESLTGARSIACAPLVARGKCLGVIELVNKREAGGFSEEDMLLLTTLADYTAISIENAIYFARIEELTISDDLTKLYNSRFLQTRLDYEIERARRFKYDLSMIFLDLDRFKQVNDRYGHLMGSKLLKEVAGLIAGTVRNIDMVCRYGGDEFIVLMPETTKANAVKVAGKLRQALKDSVFLAAEGMDIKMTGSFGVASYPVDASSKNGLIHMADEAMYAIKNAARDGVAEAKG